MNPLEGLRRRIESRRETQFNQRFQKLTDLVRWTESAGVMTIDKATEAMDLAEKLIRSRQFQQLESRLKQLETQEPDTAQRLERTFDQATYRAGERISKKRGYVK